jgi:hypothetical protein
MCSGSALPLIVALACCLVGCAPDRAIETVRRFNDVTDHQDLATARTMMASSARIWYENPLGPGEPWTLSEGRYAAWDAHFHTVKTIVGDYQRDGPWVWVITDEVNDYYRLTERNWARTYLAWRVDASNKIDGLLVAQLGEPHSRVREFREWARANEPAELDYLMPGGRLDPTGDRAPRMRALLERWRAATGLPPIPTAENRAR